MCKSYLFLFVIINANICFSMVDESKSLRLHEEQILKELQDQGLQRLYERSAQDSKQFAFKVRNLQKSWTIRGIFPNTSADDTFQIAIIKSKIKFTDEYKEILEKVLNPKDKIFDLESLEDYIVARHPFIKAKMKDQKKVQEYADLRMQEIIEKSNRVEKILADEKKQLKEQFEQEFVNKQKKSFQQMRRGFLYCTVVGFLGLSSYIWRKR